MLAGLLGAGPAQDQLRRTIVAPEALACWKPITRSAGAPPWKASKSVKPVIRPCVAAWPLAGNARTREHAAAHASAAALPSRRDEGSNEAKSVQSNTNRSDLERNRAWACAPNALLLCSKQGRPGTPWIGNRTAHRPTIFAFANGFLRTTASPSGVGAPQVLALQSRALRPRAPRARVPRPARVLRRGDLPRADRGSEPHGRARLHRLRQADAAPALRHAGRLQGRLPLVRPGPPRDDRAVRGPAPAGERDAPHRAGAASGRCVPLLPGAEALRERARGPDRRHGACPLLPDLAPAAAAVQRAAGDGAAPVARLLQHPLRARRRPLAPAGGGRVAGGRGDDSARVRLGDHRLHRDRRGVVPDCPRQAGSARPCGVRRGGRVLPTVARLHLPRHAPLPILGQLRRPVALLDGV